MVNGKIDDASHAHICEEYGEKMKAAGADIKVITKKGWGHGFEANYEAEFEPQAQVFNDCPPYYIRDDGTTNPDAVYSWDDPCIGKGNTIGGVVQGGKKSWVVFKKPVIKFFIENLLN